MLSKFFTQFSSETEVSLLRSDLKVGYECKAHHPIILRLALIIAFAQLTLAKSWLPWSQLENPKMSHTYWIRLVEYDPDQKPMQGHVQKNYDVDILSVYPNGFQNDSSLHKYIVKDISEFYFLGEPSAKVPQERAVEKNPSEYRKSSPTPGECEEEKSSEAHCFTINDPCEVKEDDSTTWIFGTFMGEADGPNRGYSVNCGGRTVVASSLKNIRQAAAQEVTVAVSDQSGASSPQASSSSKKRKRARKEKRIDMEKRITNLEAINKQLVTNNNQLVTAVKFLVEYYDGVDKGILIDWEKPLIEWLKML